MKDVKWHWSVDCRASFEKVKNILASSSVRVHFDPTVPVKLTVDT